MTWTNITELSQWHHIRAWTDHYTACYKILATDLTAILHFQTCISTAHTGYFYLTLKHNQGIEGFVSCKDQALSLTNNKERTQWSASSNTRTSCTKKIKKTKSQIKRSKLKTQQCYPLTHLHQQARRKYQNTRRTTETDNTDYESKQRQLTFTIGCIR